MREYFATIRAPFHVYNRGTEKRMIFMDYAEYCRFIFLMWVCRIGSPAPNMTKEETIKAAESILRGEKPNERVYTEEFKPLVSLITWNLMPNHFHLMLVPRIDGGISMYMKKIGDAYTKYFNARHQRTGRLFQGSYQSVAVDDPTYLSVLLRYINFNHAELVEPKWKEHIIKNIKKTRKFINSYKWSAHQDFVGGRSSLLVDRKFAQKLFEAEFTDHGLGGYKNFINQWLKDDFDEIKHYTLEN